MNERISRRVKIRLAALVAAGVVLVVPMATTSSPASLDGLFDHGADTTHTTADAVSR